MLLLLLFISFSGAKIQCFSISRIILNAILSYFFGKFYFSTKNAHSLSICNFKGLKLSFFTSFY